MANGNGSNRTIHYFPGEIPADIHPQDQGVVDVKFLLPLPDLVSTFIPQQKGRDLADLFLGFERNVMALLSALDVFKFKSILDEYGCFSWEYSFGAVTQVLLNQFFEEKRKYVRFHFPFDSDLVEISTRLLGCAGIAAATPATTYPASEPGEKHLDELVGTTGRLAAHSDRPDGLERQWYLYRCNVVSAWRHANGDGVVIADLDWGFRADHPELSERMDRVRRYNSIYDDNSIAEGRDIKHGTSVMGILGAAPGRGDQPGSSKFGITGIAPSATLWPVQAGIVGDVDLSRRKEGDPWVRGIEWVCKNAPPPPRRTVLLLEAQAGDHRNIEMIGSINEAIRLAIDKQIIVVVPAGNGTKPANRNSLGGTIEQTGSVLVGATAYHDDRDTNPQASFSNFGETVTVWAPGDPAHDLTTHTDEDVWFTNNFGGTSGAAPKVAGTIALMLEVNPTLGQKAVTEILSETGTRIPPSSERPVEGKFLNAAKAVWEAGRRVNKWGGTSYEEWLKQTD
jgi:subtilisin family serine protease